MSYFHGKNVGIISTGSFLPERVVTNAEIARTLGVDVEWIYKRTGVVERRFADASQATSDLAAAAARAALCSAGVDGCDLDVVVVATSTPDEPLPGVAPRVQAALGATSAAAFDVDAVCSGFLYALEVARGMLLTGRQRRYALVVGADTYSRILDRTDRRTYPLFGDGAGAVVLGPVIPGAGMSEGVLRADGNLVHYVRIRSGGSRAPLTEAALRAGEDRFRMRGREVRELVERLFPEVMAGVAAEHGLTATDIDHVVCHQANVRLIRHCAAEVGIPADRLLITGDQVANTAAASIPISLAAGHAAGRFHPGDSLLLIAFGGGMTWGHTVLRWSAVPPEPRFGATSPRAATPPDLSQRLTHKGT